MKLSLLFLIFALAFGAIGCSSSAPEGMNRNVVKSEKEVEKEDGSVVTVSTSPNGIKTEARTFPSGEIARVTRITTANGHRRALVEFRDARSVEISNENEVDRVIEASADIVRAAAIKAWEAKNSPGSEVADKADKAADAGKDAGKAAESGAKRGAEEVGDAASDAAEAAKKGVKKTGKGIKKVGEKIKNSATP